MRATSGFIIIFFAALVPGCNRQPDVKTPPPLEVVVSQPVKEDVENWDTYTGTVEAKESAQIVSKVRGYITDTPFEEGKEILAGAKLFLIDAREFKATLEQYQGELKKYEAALQKAEADYALKKPLADKGTVATADIVKILGDKGEAAGGVAIARGKIIEAELNISYCTITSPIDGRVGEMMYKKGELVNPGAEASLTTVQGVDPMYVSFYVNQRAFQDYRTLLLERAKKNPPKKEEKDEKDGAKKGEPKAPELKIPVKMTVGDDARTVYDGAVDFVDNRVDPNTSSIKVRARFANPKQEDGRRSLTPGLFARVKVNVVDPYPAILISERAILSDQSIKYVLVVNKEKNNTVERVDIVPEARTRENGLRAIEAGLKGNEWVIVEGVNRARPGATVNPKDTAMPRRPVAK